MVQFLQAFFINIKNGASQRKEVVASSGSSVVTTSVVVVISGVVGTLVFSVGIAGVVVVLGRSVLVGAHEVDHGL
uniref:Pilus assembly protein n=1 Tax=Bursaphelenchus xylophilus TaxID=6326 RepID=A0A1I7RW39_BURXY